MSTMKTLKAMIFTASSAALLSVAAPDARAASPYDQAALNLRPVMYLNMDPAAAPVDLSGNGHAGSYIGGVPASATMPNGEKAPSFNGINQYLTVPSSPKLSVPTKRVLTIVAWIKPSTLQFPHTENEEFVYWLGKGNPTQGYEYANRMYSKVNSVNRPNRISVYQWNPNGGLGSGSYFEDAVNTTDWIMVTDVIDMNKGTVDIYKNGVLRDSTPLSQYSVTPQTTNSPFNIGTRNLNSWFQGAVGKVSVHDRLLTTAELATLYKAMMTGGSVPADTTAPSIAGVTASGLTASGASVVWSTNEAADSQVEYGPTTAYGQSTPLDASRVTAHSVALTGLTASTLYHYRVKSKDAAGNSASSPDQIFTTTSAPLPPVPAGCVASAGAWQNKTFASQTGTFTAEYDAKPSAANIDGVTGLSRGAASGYPSLAAVVRFNNAGRFDARNGAAYAAATSIPYAAGLTYRVRLVVNTAAKTYSAFVRQGAGPEQLIGSNYSFRAEQAGTASLDNLGLLATGGSVQACGLAVKTVDISAPVVSLTAPAAGATASGTTNVTASAADNVAVAKVQLKLDGVDLGPALTAAPYSYAWNTTAATNGSHSLTAVATDAAGNSATSAPRSVTVSNGVPAPVPSACVTSAGTWQSQALVGQSGIFTALYDAKPSAANIDGVTGLSRGAASGYPSLAAAVRFNNTGRVDARNGAAYAAATGIPYAAGQTYRVRLVVNMTAKTYSAYIRQGTGTEQLIGSNYAFRTEQAMATSLDNLGLLSTGGSLSACSATTSVTTASL